MSTAKISESKFRFCWMFRETHFTKPAALYNGKPKWRKAAADPLYQHLSERGTAKQKPVIAESPISRQED